MKFLQVALSFAMNDLNCKTKKTTFYIGIDKRGRHFLTRQAYEDDFRHFKKSRKIAHIYFLYAFMIEFASLLNYKFQRRFHRYVLVMRHISAITFQIIMSTCQILMLTTQLFMSTCQIIMSTCQKNLITISSLIYCFYGVLTPFVAIYLSI